MSEALDPLDPELARLLDAERTSEGATRAEVDQVIGKLASTFGAAWGSGGGGDAGGGGAGDAGNVGTAGTAGSAALTAAGTSTQAAATGWLGKAVTIAAVSFAAGGATGAVLHAKLASPVMPDPVASSIGLAAPTTSSVPASTSAELGPVAESPPRTMPSQAQGSRPRSAAVATTASSAWPSSDTILARERSLLQGARVLLLRGQPEASLGVLDEHERQFPRGELIEEREVLRIQALARAGRTTEASARAVRFRQQYPRSLSLPIVDAALVP
jgi:hypothetical protein